MDNLQAAVNKHDREIVAHTEQIKTLFAQQEGLAELTRTVATLAERMRSVSDGQAKIEKSLDDIKAVPARNWQTLIAALLSGVVGAGIGILLK